MPLLFYLMQNKTNTWEVRDRSNSCNLDIIAQFPKGQPAEQRKDGAEARRGIASLPHTSCQQASGRCRLSRDRCGCRRHAERSNNSDEKGATQLRALESVPECVKVIIILPIKKKNHTKRCCRKCFVKTRIQQKKKPASLKKIQKGLF